MFSCVYYMSRYVSVMIQRKKALTSANAWSLLIWSLVVGVIRPITASWLRACPTLPAGYGFRRCTECAMVFACSPRNGSAGIPLGPTPLLVAICQR